MSDSHDLSAVEALLEERDAVAGWLARVDERGSTVPESVRERVRQDYRDRLDGLTDRLREHADAVGSRLAADRAEHDGLMRRAGAAREALAEVELRHGVGEYDDQRFESERSRHVAELQEVEDTIGAVADRIARMEEVHAVVTAPAGPRPTRSAAPVAPEEPLTLPPEPEPWPEEAPPEPEPEPAASAGESGESPVADIADLAPGPEDEEPDTDDLLSIFDQAAADEGPSRRGPTEADPSMPSYGPLSFTPSGPELPRSGKSISSSSPPLGLPDPDQPPRFVRPGTEGRRERPEATSTSTSRAEAIRVIPDPDPVLPEVPPDVGGDVVARTLRCGECGAMNRPLEWYCEKCGAELSAV